MKITEKVKQLEFPLGSYVVIGSGVLEILGLRKSRDLDIAVLPELHAQLRATGMWREEEKDGKIFLMRDDVEIIPELSWADYPTSTKEAIASAMMIEGVPFMNFRELLKFKQALGRPKDQADIALIDAYEKRTTREGPR